MKIIPLHLSRRKALTYNPSLDPETLDPPEPKALT
jgi:hypothetical protein